jgi:hypothetical protein
LWVMHQPRSGPPRLLWPAGEGTGASLQNRVNAGTEINIPPAPAVFEFDTQPGTETLYLAITSTPVPVSTDRLSAPAAKQSPVAAAQSGRPSDRPAPTQFSNIDLRSIVVEADRGVLYRPEPASNDPHTYFSGAKQDPSAPAVIRLQLKHAR